MLSELFCLPTTFPSSICGTRDIWCLWANIVLGWSYHQSTDTSARSRLNGIVRDEACLASRYTVSFVARALKTNIVNRLTLLSLMSSYVVVVTTYGGTHQCRQSCKIDDILFSVTLNTCVETSPCWTYNNTLCLYRNTLEFKTCFMYTATKTGCK